MGKPEYKDCQGKSSIDELVAFFISCKAIRGKELTNVKGMVLIFSVCIIPSLWAVIDYLDDKLWDAMYGG